MLQTPECNSWDVVDRKRMDSELSSDIYTHVRTKLTKSIRQTSERVVLAAPGWERTQGPGFNSSTHIGKSKTNHKRKEVMALFQSKASV